MDQETARILQLRTETKETGSGGTGDSSTESDRSDDTEGLEAPTEDEAEALSPFINGTNLQYAWDSTSLESLKRCPRLYYYNMILGYRSKKENVHLRFGSEAHQAFQEYEILKAGGMDHEEASFHVVKGLLQRTDDWRPDHKHKNRPFLIRTVVWYLEKFKDDPATTYILDNGKPAVELSFNFELDWGPPYLLCGHIDRVVTYQDELFSTDVKTTTYSPTDSYWNQFEPNNQMSLYTLAGQIILNLTIKGIIITSAQIMIEGTRFSRHITYRTKDQLDEWLRDLKLWTKKAVEYAEEEYWPMNDTACDKYGGCAYRGICSKSPSVRQRFLDSEFERGEIWNPLKVR
jgi:hypothetical protein